MKEKENKKRAKTAFKRKIHLLGKEWSYKVIHNALLVVDPAGLKMWKRDLKRPYSDCPGLDNGCIACEMGDSHLIGVEITPARVKKFIERVCLK